MGFPTKIQLIKRAKSEQWCINFPSAIAQAMEFERGEVVEWFIEDKHKMILKSDESFLDVKKKWPAVIGSQRHHLQVVLLKPPGY